MSGEVWAVVHGNYEPAEVDEIYDNETAATEHANALGGQWHAERWPVRSTYRATWRITR